MSADFGPCADWPVRWPCDVSTESPTVTGKAVSMATYVLWSLTGRQYGTCSVTLRPCRRECYDSSWWTDYGMPWTTAWDFTSASWPWFPSGCGGCRGSCSCAEISEVILPNPVNSVTTVKLDGVAAPTGSYRVDNNRLLVRTDGQRWPSCNNLNLADTQVGTWSVTALYGQAVPSFADLAVGELACELIRAMNGEDCRLPAGITSLVREGVTIRFPDPGELVAKGRTGLYVTDMFIKSVNPYGLKQRARVYSPDRIPPRRAGT